MTKELPWFAAQPWAIGAESTRSVGSATSPDVGSMPAVVMSIVPLKAKVAPVAVMSLKKVELGRG